MALPLPLIDRTPLLAPLYPHPNPPPITPLSPPSIRTYLKPAYALSPCRPSTILHLAHHPPNNLLSKN